MVKLRILEILEEQGKTRYWLNQRMNMHYVSFKKMIENQTDSIHFETLNKLSDLLNVPIGDLFEKTDDKDSDF
ncbi:MAG: helix-turn-helix transcriptional regulator [Lachnospiraceae bacterium]|nr:helix-turn-helix transcriptional regulator [Lachnospiraceae bacterium]